MRFGRAALAVLTLALGAPGCRSEGDELSASRETIRSWASTVQLASAKWSAGELPRPYMKVLTRTASREVAKEVRRLEKIASKTASSEAAAAAGEARALEARIRFLRASLEPRKTSGP